MAEKNTLDTVKDDVHQYIDDFYTATEWTAAETFSNMEEEDYSPDSEYADYMRALAGDLKSYAPLIDDEKEKQRALYISDSLQDCADNLSVDTPLDPKALVMDAHITIGNNEIECVNNAKSLDDMLRELAFTETRMRNNDLNIFELSDSEIEEFQNRSEQLQNSIFSTRNRLSMIIDNAADAPDPADYIRTNTEQLMNRELYMIGNNVKNIADIPTDEQLSNRLMDGAQYSYAFNLDEIRNDLDRVDDLGLTGYRAFDTTDARKMIDVVEFARTDPSLANNIEKTRDDLMKVYDGKAIDIPKPVAVDVSAPAKTVTRNKNDIER